MSNAVVQHMNHLEEFSIKIVAKDYVDDDWEKMNALMARIGRMPECMIVEPDNVGLRVVLAVKDDVTYVQILQDMANEGLG